MLKISIYHPMGKKSIMYFKCNNTCTSRILQTKFLCQSEGLDRELGLWRSNPLRAGLSGYNAGGIADRRKYGTRILQRHRISLRVLFPQEVLGCGGNFSIANRCATSYAVMLFWFRGHHAKAAGAKSLTY